MTYETLAFDRASVRRIDDNGFMHVAVSPFTREQVAPYYGYEIPGWEELKLDPQKIYYGYRPAEELAKPETVVSINGDYANLITDDGQPHSITMFLLPEGTSVGTRLKLESFMWEIIE